MNDERPARESGGDQVRAAADEQTTGGVSGDTGFFSAAGRTVAAGAPAEDAGQRESVAFRLDDYELFERLGEGGMGVVYRAEQKSVRRTVALKLIRPDRLDTLDSQARGEIVERFRTEAQAAAKLDHPNVVSVFQVGEAEGRPFFSMRFVPGRTLAAVLREGPLENRRAGEYVERIALAIQHAHEHGILHRDLKPQNILIDERTDEPCVTDFGLAKLAAAETAVTRQGEVIGTPQYMSPEQSRDSASVTPLSDVYSLGATLYHLLTGRPPFQAATPVETLRQVLLEVPVPPRRLNPGIDRDLETICLKCLEKEPARRYESAGHLAEDLGRYRAGRPIHARPISWAGRVGRWARRNPAVATLTLTAVTLLLAALVATTVGYVTTDFQRRRAEQGFALARDAVNDFFTRVSEEALLDQPGMQPYRRELLQRALVYYRTVLEQYDDRDASLRDELAATRFRVGVIVEQLEGPAAAVEHFLQARDTQRGLVSERPTTPRRAALSDTANALGRARHKLEQYDLAEQAYGEAITLRHALAEESSAAAGIHRKLANSLMNQALLDRDRGALSLAAEGMEQAQRIRERLLATGPDRRVLRDLAMGCYNRANLFIEADRIEPGRTQLDEAVRLFQKLLDDQPFDIQNRYRLAVCLRNLADLEDAVADAEAGYRKALELLAPLVAQNPQVVKYRYELAAVLLNLGQLQYERRELLASLESLKQARRHLVQLAEAAPDNKTFPNYLSSANLVIKKVESEIGDGGSGDTVRP